MEIFMAEDITPYEWMAMINTFTTGAIAGML